jgi:hypothetical protein
MLRAMSRFSELFLKFERQVVERVGAWGTFFGFVAVIVAAIGLAMTWLFNNK